MWKVAGGYGAMAVAFGRCNCGSCGRGRKLRLANGLFVAWRPRVLAGPDRATSREDTQYPCVHVLSIDFALLSRTFVPVTRQNDLGSWLLRENFVTEQNTSCRQDKNNNAAALCWRSLSPERSVPGEFMSARFPCGCQFEFPCGL